MTVTLRGERYAKDKDLAKFITEDLPYLDFPTTVQFYADFLQAQPDDDDLALLGCNDRYFLLTQLCGRKDALHPWLFGRCREVEASPDDHLDLWARDHYKSTIITFSGALQEIAADPEVTIGLFSFNQAIARAFVKQVKRELEQNELLKRIYADCLFRDPANESPLWTDHGFIVKRQTNPKEGTLEGWGLVTGQPTSKHYALRIYDDVVTRDSVTNPEMVKKVTEAYELSDNLGGRLQRKWLIGTRYSFGDTYGVILEKGVVKPRIYPATHNGKIDGDPVFLTREKWEKKKKEQSSQIAAQMLQNPLAGTEQVFKPEWLRPWLIRPRTVNVYIMIDPSMGRSSSSDRTAISVIAVDQAMNKYLIDGYRHRMSLSERWQAMKSLWNHWRDQTGVAHVAFGYERYGMQSDMEYIRERMSQEGFSFPLEELSWTREGNESKQARVQRLEPELRDSRFFLPALVWNHGTPQNLWSVNTEKGHVDLRPLIAPTRQMQTMKEQGEGYRLAKPIVRKDEHGKLYDVTRALMEELIFFPFGTHDDLVDATSRIFDMQPIPPAIHETQAAIEAREMAFPDA
jgi:hypothetical protein